MINSQYVDLSLVIRETIRQVYYLRSLVESVIMNIGEDGDTERIEEIKQKAKNAEAQIESGITLILKRSRKVCLDSRKKIEIHKKDLEMSKMLKNSKCFINSFKNSLTKYNLCDFPQVPVNMDREIESFKYALQKKKLGIETFNYTILEGGVYRVDVRFLYGIRVTITVSDGLIKQYFFKLDHHSLINLQLLALLEAKWENHLASEGRNFSICLDKIGVWMEVRKNIFTQKCYICSLHLSFQTGVPMVPMIVLQDKCFSSSHDKYKYYHIECFFDTKI